MTHNPQHREATVIVCRDETADFLPAGVQARLRAAQLTVDDLKRLAVGMDARFTNPTRPEDS
ncbi:hypothetical protein ABZ845_05545 [Streptomyces sp. NPDC047022]|uniref:hypothetical protein n=1 Tax=Streptomyces sp. NPDC047022 TaxID=3155737 RepID=UPI0033FD387F